MTDLEKIRISAQDRKLGLAIYELTKKHKNIGVFGAIADNEYVKWAKSMYLACRVGNAIFDVAWDKDKKNSSNYDALLLIDFKFNSRLNEIKFDKTTSNEVGLEGSIPVIRITYHLMGETYDAGRDTPYIWDGISGINLNKIGE